MLDFVLVRGSDDWVMAAEVAEAAKFVGGATTPAAIRELSMVLIGELLRDGLVEIGELVESGFRPWGVSDVEALARVDRAWRAMPAGPRLGDVCWLNLTQKGELAAAEALRRLPPRR
jgi:hypothetical protein